MPRGAPKANHCQRLFRLLLSSPPSPSRLWPVVRSLSCVAFAAPSWFSGWSSADPVFAAFESSGCRASTFGEAPVEFGVEFIMVVVPLLGFAPGNQFPVWIVPIATRAVGSRSLERRSKCRELQRQFLQSARCSRTSVGFPSRSTVRGESSSSFSREGSATKLCGLGARLQMGGPPRMGTLSQC